MPGTAPNGKPGIDLATAEKQAQVVEYVRQGLGFREIAQAVGLSKSQVHRIFHAALDRIPAENVGTYRDEQLAELALLRREARDVLAARHVSISNGRVVCEITGTDDDGKPIYGEPYEDDGVTLAAIDTLLRINKREAEVVGSDAEKKLEVSGSLRYEIVGIPDEDLT